MSDEGSALKEFLAGVLWANKGLARSAARGDYIARATLVGETSLTLAEIDADTIYSGFAALDWKGHLVSSEVAGSG
ncbi:MAG: hypothetical protein KDJ44_21665 [Rhodoblastus sp.]|nr:hypothetical protein [Rhodoblastus sp.]